MFFYIRLVQKREERMWLFIVFCGSGCHLPCIQPHRHQNTVLWWWFKDLQSLRNTRHENGQFYEQICLLHLLIFQYISCSLNILFFWNLFQTTRSWRERPGFAVSWNTRILVMDSFFFQRRFTRDLYYLMVTKDEEMTEKNSLCSSTPWQHIGGGLPLPSFWSVSIYIKLISFSPHFLLGSLSQSLCGIRHLVALDCPIYKVLLIFMW